MAMHWHMGKQTYLNHRDIQVAMQSLVQIIGATPKATHVRHNLLSNHKTLKQAGEENAKSASWERLCTIAPRAKSSITIIGSAICLLIAMSTQTISHYSI